VQTLLGYEEAQMSSSDSRYELVALNLVAGHSQIEAVRLAGFAGNSRGTASAICRSQRVQDRVDELLQEVEERVLRRAMWDRLHILKFLQANAIESRAKGDYAPSNRAIELLGRDQGMFGSQPKMCEPQEANEIEDQAELAASWLEEMEEKLQISTIKELAFALRDSHAAPIQ
jgi:hypothetical protein